MSHHKDFLSYVCLNQFFHGFRPEWLVHKVVELRYNSQSNEVVHDVSGRNRRQNNLDVDDFDADDRERLQETGHTRRQVALKHVGMIEYKFEILLAFGNLVNQWQMQNSAADEATKQDNHSNLIRK